jgi:cytochrome c oxidase assembly factor 6
MGFFSKSTSEPLPEAMQKKSTRQECWDSRDRFFACLDKNNIIDAIKEDAKARTACSSEVNEFESHCISSWVR